MGDLGLGGSGQVGVAGSSGSISSDPCSLAIKRYEIPKCVY